MDSNVIVRNETLTDLDETETMEDEDLQKDDSFYFHFCKDISDDDVNLIDKNDKFLIKDHWPALGKLAFSNHKSNLQMLHRCSDIKNVNVVPFLKRNLEKAMSSTLSEYQMEIFSILYQYKDFVHNERTLVNGEEIRFVYCLHALNHVLKTRSQIMHHNVKLRKKGDVNSDYRDQGFTRPKVLILVPYKESALRVVKLCTNLLVPDSKSNVVNKKRFQDEFGCNEPPAKKLKSKPGDHDAMFAGNVDDSFRIGMAVTKRSLRLYADFYSADIIVASPLGLRTIIGAEGEKTRDFDFLSSIEILIIDQADVFLMQNWEHVVHSLQHLNRQSKAAHGIDFSRIRMWTLNGHAKYYRQSAIFSSVNIPAITSLFNKYCANRAGSVVLHNFVLGGSIQEVFVQIPQVFYRFEAFQVQDIPDARFKFFLEKILPNFKDAVMQHTLIFIPSYFDFVRIRNYFKREDISFVQICEYTKEGKVARARDMFFHGQKHFLLYTERAHFYNRHRIKGVRHVIFYELPVYPHFYSELSNFLHPDLWGKHNGKLTNTSSICLYSKYDAQQLAAVVGCERMKIMVSSQKKVHMYSTEKA